MAFTNGHRGVHGALLVQLSGGGARFVQTLMAVQDVSHIALHMTERLAVPVQQLDIVLPSRRCSSVLFDQCCMGELTINVSIWPGPDPAFIPFSVACDCLDCLLFKCDTCHYSLYQPTTREKTHREDGVMEHETCDEQLSQQDVTSSASVVKSGRRMSHVPFPHLHCVSFLLEVRHCQIIKGATLSCLETGDA